MMTYQYYAQISNLERTSISMIKQHLSVLQGELEEEFSEYDSYQHGERAVSEFGLMHETRSLSVIDENNRVLFATKYSWKKQRAEKVIPNFDANLGNETKQKQMPVIFLAQDHMSIHVYYPLRLLPKIGQLSLPLAGVIFLDYDLSIARTLIQNNKLNEGCVFAVVGLLFMGMLISLLNVLLARPIQHLSETTLRLAKGELGIQLNEYGQGELAVLGSAFNKMSQQIDGYINKIRRSERDLSITLDSIGDAVIVTNASGKIIRINPVSAKLTGWSVMDAVGKPLEEVFNIIDSNTRKTADNPVTKVLNRGSVVGLSKHTALIARDGSEYQIADSAAPIIDTTGKINGVVLVFRDVTAEYTLQSALAESEVRFRNLVESSSDWIWEVDSNGRYTYVSPHCFQILGYRPEELIGKTPFDLMSDEEAARVQGEECAVDIVTHRTLSNMENITLHKEGYQVVLETNSVPYFDFNNKLLGYRGVDRDITKRKREEEELRITNHRYRTLIDFAPEALTIFDQNTMRFVDANQNTLDLFSMSREDFLKCSLVEISPLFQSDGRKTVDVVGERIKEIDHGGQNTLEWLHKNAQGKIFPCEIRIVKLPSADGKLIRISIIDISERKQNEAALAESEKRFRQLFEKIPNIAVQGYDSDRKVIFWNLASEKLYGYSKEEALGIKIENLIVPEERSDQILPAFDQWIKKDKPIPTSEHELQHKNGSRIPVFSNQIILNNAQGKPEIYCIDIDLSERRKAQAEIEQLAYFDVLTGLPNRRLFLDRLNEEIAVAERHLGSAAILYMDLDNFKTINDSLGHAVGDELLIEIGNRIKDQIRGEDTVSRFGGDEFVVLLKEIDRNTDTAGNLAQLVAEKIQKALSEIIVIDQHELFITSSIGISLFLAENYNAVDLLIQADTAMYRAKEAGRNCIRFFEPTMQIAANTLLLLEKGLRLALLRGEFFLLYQPQVNLDGNIIGVEALLRWKHPSRGTILPEEFIAVAEDSRIILQIGEWVLMTACQQLKEWEKIYQDMEFHMAVNVSPHQFRMTDFVNQLQHVVEQTGIDPKRLGLEVTEGVVIEDIKDTVKKMHTLKKMGIRFSIDDFGTGYSSLSSLKTLPLDQLKIDQSFVRDIFLDPNDETIIETIITMAHILGMEVIAEGVENKEQVQFLTEKGCKIFQGYYFYKPLIAEKITEKMVSYVH